MWIKPSALVSAAFLLASAALARPAAWELSDSGLESAVMGQRLLPRDKQYNNTIIDKYDRKLVTDYPIHSSCKGSERLQLERGLFELKRLVRASVDHLLLYGNKSELFTTYFGATANVATPLGIYERVINGDKSNNLFRCDDPDKNCHQDGWAGHWRGKNATGETVICPLSYKTRLSIEKFCSDGFTLAKDELNIYWATDLLHRSLHLPQITDGLVEHLAEGFSESLELAHQDVTKSVLNTDSIQMFAFEAWSRANVDPASCRGTLEEGGHDHDGHGHADAHGSAGASAAPASPSASASTKDCHAHADGTEHCT
ncbi:unnamed protein product [Parajaminaea phylloscopi]